MKAIGVRSPLPIDDPASLTDVDLPRPEPTGRDLLVRIEAVSVNPVDTKIRMGPSAEPGSFRVLGDDGIVDTLASALFVFASVAVLIVAAGTQYRFFAGAGGRLPGAASLESGKGRASQLTTRFPC